jgi:hypothetical protein
VTNFSIETKPNNRGTEVCTQLEDNAQVSLVWHKEGASPSTQDQ